MTYVRLFLYAQNIVYYIVLIQYDEGSVNSILHYGWDKVSNLVTDNIAAAYMYMYISVAREYNVKSLHTVPIMYIGI